MNPAEKRTSYNLFQEPWWLDAVAPGAWQEVRVERGGQVVGRLPFVISSRRGMTFIEMPPVTQTLGPWIQPSEAKYANQLGDQKDVFSELIEKLPKHDVFRQSFAPEVQNWMPFYWAGFEQTTCYTYRINDLTDLDRVWAETRENVRTDIRKAEKSLLVCDDLGLPEILKLASMSYERAGRSWPYSAELMSRIDQAAAARQARRILFAKDAQGNVHGAIYLLNDERTTYYLMGGSNPEFKGSGANSLLLWHAIKDAAKVSRSFDFEGSMNENIERFFRAFGARQTPYFQVSRLNRKAKVLKGLQDVVRAVTGR
jgi:hypothetical protein